MSEEFEVHGQHDHAVEQAADAASVRTFEPNHRLAQALALVQVAIAPAAVTVLTGQRCLPGFSGLCAATGLGIWIAAGV